MDMNTTIKIANSMMEMDRIIKELIDAGFENLGSWEFYNRKIDIKVIVKVELGF